ncbi:MAG: NUDIX hydrolase [Eubacteriales bacterium]|nr:NUDIX hydrolase [Eubacteriales bacterium]
MKQQTSYEGLFEEPVSSEEIYRGKIVHLFCDTVRLPNGKSAMREVMRHPGAVCVVPLTEDGEVIMVRQYRHPFSRTLLEAPAGKLDPGELPEVCARRELSEETGAEAGELEFIGDFYPSVAVLDENIHLYIARNLTFRNQHTDEDEFLRVERVPLATLVEQVLSGEICDGKTQAAILKTWLIEQKKR